MPSPQRMVGLVTQRAPLDDLAGYRLSIELERAILIVVYASAIGRDGERNRLRLRYYGTAISKPRWPGDTGID